ncbi:MAG: nucleoside monophosphate kinase [Candidatus Jorgensenbacteria bacterium]
MQKQAVILFGPPGSGKGTQAELLARRFPFIHVDSGRMIENAVHAPGAERDPVLRAQRKNFDTGKLCDPAWYLKLVKETARRIADMGSSVVFSGAFRTYQETFGEGRERGLLAALAKFYGEKNVHVVMLNIRPATTLKRNTKRKICAVCGFQQLPGATHPRCLFCDGPMRVRSLDNPNVIRERLKEYHARTSPIVAALKKHGVRVTKINGEPAPYLVFESVSRALGLKLKKTK